MRKVKKKDESEVCKSQRDWQRVWPGEEKAQCELLDALAAYGNGALVALNKFITGDITGRTNNRP